MCTWLSHLFRELPLMKLHTVKGVDLYGGGEVPKGAADPH